MSLIVEDGTGLANAESYISVADADTRHTNLGNFTVYGLYDASGELRYIGQSRVPLWKRLADHVAHAKADDPRPVLRWLWDVYSRGGVVTIVPLKLNAVRNDDEAAIIKRMVRLGHNLLNVEHTGRKAAMSRGQMADEATRARHRAAVIASMTPDRRVKISAALKGKPKSPAHRAAISAATKGRDNRRPKP